MAFRLIRSDTAEPRDTRSRHTREALNQIASEMHAAASAVFKQKEQLDARERVLRERRDDREGRSSERAIALAVLRYLADDSDGEATLEEIREVLPLYMSLTTADLAPLESRGGEKAWIQQMRNIISHRQVGGNFIRDGLVEYNPPGRLRITDAGKEALAQSAINTGNSTDE